MIEREALAAISVLKEFYPYVYGFPCRLVTDNNPLTALKGFKDVGQEPMDAFSSAVCPRNCVQARETATPCLGFPQMWSQ